MLLIRDRRLWLFGRRCHHGATGIALAACGLLAPHPYGPILFGLGVALIVDDWPDAPWIPVRQDEGTLA